MKDEEGFAGPRVGSAFWVEGVASGKAGRPEGARHAGEPEARMAGAQAQSAASGGRLDCTGPTKPPQRVWISI